jgi:hypothetical protein
MLVGMLALAVLVGGYLTIVSPERQKASKLAGEVQSAHQQLQSVETQAAEASAARTRYASTYASLVSLGPAVPATSETPALVYALESATHSRNVEFNSITSGSGSGSSSPSASSASTAASSAAAAASAAAFVAEPFTFVFNGSFVDLYKLLAQLEGFTAQTASGSLRVSGRLLTIGGVQLAGGEPASSGSSGSSKAKPGRLKVTVTATAYVLAPGQSMPTGGSPSTPVGIAPAASSSGASSPTSAAVVKAGP